MFWKIKRWWLFRLAPVPKIGDIMVFYPFDSKDTLRQELVLKGIKDVFILYTYVGCQDVTLMYYEDFFELYINKEFIESWGIKL